MNNYKIKYAIGNYVIIEPMDKSTVLKTEETATIFKVISVGQHVKSGDLIIVAPGSVERTMMQDKEVFYVLDTSIIATIE